METFVSQKETFVARKETFVAREETFVARKETFVAREETNVVRNLFYWSRNFVVRVGKINGPQIRPGGQIGWIYTDIEVVSKSHLTVSNSDNCKASFYYPNLKP